MENLEDVLSFGLRKLGFSEFRPLQRDVVEGYLSGKDVFFRSPTGSGKSLCFEIAPFVFDAISVGVEYAESQASPSSVCLIVTPLVSLMKSQVADLRSRGISAAIIGPESNAAELRDIRLSRFNLVFGSPEALLNSHRSVFRDLKDSIKAVFIDESHCVAKWGKDNNVGRNAAAFRADYGRLGELRSLLKKDVPFICLTATATDKTKDIIVKDLCMEECTVVDSDPNRPNTKYSVLVPNTDSLYEWFEWLIRELETEQQKTEKVIVFCRRKEHMKELYELFVEHLGDKAYYRPTGTEPKDDRSRLFGMYHKRTHKTVKETIEQEFCKADGVVRVLFCSIAFGMGVNVKNIYMDIHIGPSTDLDDYLQETGRIGRDSTKMSHAVLLKFKGCTGTKNISKEMRSYVNNTTKCRRQMLLEQFKSSAPKDKILHSCCDLCAIQCKCLCSCGDTDCSCELTCEREKYLSRMDKFFGSRNKGNTAKQRDKVNFLSVDTINIIRKELMDYRLTLATGAKDKLVTGTDVATGYSKQLIDSIISDIAYIGDRDYLQCNFPFYSDDHVTITWEIIEGHLQSHDDTSMCASSDSEYSSDTEPEIESGSSTDCSSGSPIIQRRKPKIRGILFSEDESSSEVESE